MPKSALLKRRWEIGGFGGGLLTPAPGSLMPGQLQPGSLSSQEGDDPPHQDSSLSWGGQCSPFPELFLESSVLYVCYQLKLQYTWAVVSGMIF